MEPLIIYKGTDEQFLIKLYQDEKSIEPINIDDLFDLKVYLSIGGYLLGQWNKAGSGDFEALTRTDAYNYYFWLKTNENTKIGIVNMRFEIQETELELQDEIQDTIRASLSIAQIQQVPIQV